MSVPGNLGTADLSGCEGRSVAPSISAAAPPRVVVVGGGLAGLAAAVALAPRGFRVTLLESRPRWGGRASSFADQTTGEVIDNCQHVSMGCCTSFRQFCETIGIQEFFRRESTLWFWGPDGSRNRFRAVPMPAPLHLFPALLGLQYLTLAEKWRLAWGLRALARTPDAATAPDSTEAGFTATPPEESFDRWLVRHRQSPRLIERFWHVVLVSALSESVDRIGVSAARKVFVDGFLKHRAGWEVWLPFRPLDDLYGERLHAWLTQHAVDARLQCGVQQVLMAGGRAIGVETRQRERIEADHVVLAVPSHLWLSLWPESVVHPQRSAIEQLQFAPISSAHLWFDRPITDLPHVTLVGRTSQWVFPRSQPASESGGANRHYYQVVISASRALDARPQADVIAEVVQELADVFPEARAARLLHARLVTEHKAALSMQPGVEQGRPPQQSPIANLQIAGDWTSTGWPSTMEGAVRSGYLAAENILRQCGRPEPIIPPDLRPALLSRMLFGL